MTNRAYSLAVGFVGLLASTCAKRIPEPVNLTPGTPHVTWVLMYGDRRKPDANVACQSEPRTDCVLPASRANADILCDLHIYYHGAGSETLYEGTKTLGFLQGGPDSHTTRTRITVQKKAEAIANQSVTGIVTRSPGSYTVTLDLIATATDTGKQQPVRESFQVLVK